MVDKKRKKAELRKDPIRSKIPGKEPSGSQINASNNSFFFTKYVMDGRAKNTMGDMDPREALLKMEELCKSDPIFFGRAYENTQPKIQLHDKSFEEEQEDHKKKQKL